MANKLQSVFNSDEDIFSGIIRFKDIASSNAFSEAIKAVYENGESAHISGVEELSWGINTGTAKFPLEKNSRIEDMVIGPSPDIKTITLDINGMKVEFPLIVFKLKNGCIVTTEDDSIISVKMTFKYDSEAAKVSITPHFDRAKQAAELLKNIQETKCLFEYFFVKDMQDSNSDIVQLQQYFEYLYDVIDRIDFVEKKLGLSLNYAELDFDDLDSLQDLFELCLVLRDKKALRLNTKLTSTEETGIQLPNINHEIKENADIVMSFLGDMEYRFWGKNVKLFTANLVCNAVIKSYETQDTGGVRITYGDSESRPMYISYKGFISEDEAKEELKTLMNHIEEYKDAKLPSQYWEEKG